MLSICDAGLEKVYGEAREQYQTRDQRLIPKFHQTNEGFLGIPDEECAISPPSHRAQKRLDVEDVQAFQARGAREVGLVVKTSDVRKECAASPDTSDTADKLASPTTSGSRKGTARRDRSLELPASSQKTNSDLKS